MQVAVTIRLYGYMDKNMLNKGKRFEIIKQMLLRINVFTNRMLKGGGVIIPGHESLDRENNKQNRNTCLIFMKINRNFYYLVYTLLFKWTLESQSYS